jgi:ActR/RegA family two-component response regulator
MTPAEFSRLYQCSDRWVYMQCKKLGINPRNLSPKDVTRIKEIPLVHRVRHRDVIKAYFRMSRSVTETARVLDMRRVNVLRHLNKEGLE